ncbi:cilia- and flagella-associated protein 53 [Gracilinanus agilis]|uniref:cilia- and flagella-associated protein 53 n=1 Tax=Gracilinanus agilis TaxID=191870 RepID=UPI001CFCF3D2|nr:cilia- and flagella-associated protein 53 [Gracilinanus agilis]
MRQAQWSQSGLGPWRCALAVVCQPQPGVPRPQVGGGGLAHASLELFPESATQRAKQPSEQIAEKQLRKIRHNAFKKEMIEAAIKEHEKFCLGSQWDVHIDKKYINNLVQRKVEDAMQGFLINVEERRKRLRDLLEAEENQYLMEIQAGEVTKSIRCDEILQKTRRLREEREKEREHFVAKKRDQQFREQCEELRALLSLQDKQKVCEERKVQLAFNEELRKQQIIEDNMFIALWESDRLAKERREAQESCEKAKRDEQTVLCLDAQMASLNAQKEEAKRLKREEALFLEKRVAQLKLEDERARQEKRRKMLETRDILQKALQERNERLAQERAEDLYMDNKLLEIALQETRDEAQEMRQKKEDTTRETRLYQAYLKERQEAERNHEDEADKIIAADVAKIKAKKEAQLMLEKDARKRLMDDVMCTRRLQVIEKLEREAKEKDIDRELIMKGFEELERTSTENSMRKHQEKIDYRMHLLSQIEDQHKKRDAEKLAERKEYEAGLEATKFFNERIQEVLAAQKTEQEHIHPFRRTKNPLSKCI